MHADTLTINGAQLYVEQAGAGQPLVLIHGFSLDTRMWDDQLAALAQAHHVIRYDLRGFGRSALPVPGVRYTHADDLAALLSQLGIARAHVVGLSLGGGIALDFACLHPDRLAALVLIDTAIGGYPWTMDVNVHARELGVEAARERWLAHPLFAPAMRQPAVAARLRQMIGDYSGWHWVNRDPDYFPPPKVYTRLEQIAARTLAIVGEWDVPDFQGMAAAIRERVPRAQGATVAGAGHMANMEQPAAVNAAILEFLVQSNG